MIAAFYVSAGLVVAAALTGATLVWRRQAARPVTSSARDIGGTTCFPQVKR